MDLRQVRKEQPATLKVVKVRTMFNYATNQVWYQGMRVPASAVIGEVGKGFRYVLDGWNAERILLSAEAVGDGYWFTQRAVAYANSREVYGRKIGTNQGVQFPIADAYMKVRAADMMRYEAARLFDAGEPCGAEANMAMHLSSEASWAAANSYLDTHGGYGFVDEYDVERKFRENPHVPSRAREQQHDQEFHRPQGARPPPLLLARRHSDGMPGVTGPRRHANETKNRHLIQKHAGTD